MTHVLLKHSHTPFRNPSPILRTRTLYIFYKTGLGREGNSECVHYLLHKAIEQCVIQHHYYLSETAEDFIILHKWVIAYLDSKGDIYPDLPVGLSSREWRNLLSNEGLLWKATSRNHLEIIKLLLESLSSEEVIQLSATDQAIFLAIEIAIICNRHEILRYILNHVRAAGVSTLSTFLTSDTTLEDIGSFAGCDEQVVECILDSLETPEEKFKLLTSSSLSGSDYSVMPDNIQTAELMLKHLNNDQLYQYVKSRCHKLDYVVANLYLESTFHFDEPDIVKLLMDALTAEQRLCILRLSENSLFCEDEGYKSPLGSMRTASLAEIAEAVSTDDEGENINMFISSMVWSLPLGQYHLSNVPIRQCFQFTMAIKHSDKTIISDIAIHLHKVL